MIDLNNKFSHWGIVLLFSALTSMFGLLMVAFSSIVDPDSQTFYVIASLIMMNMLTWIIAAEVGVRKV